jgi:hypothetical protein
MNEMVTPDQGMKVERKSPLGMDLVKTGEVYGAGKTIAENKEVYHNDIIIPKLRLQQGNPREHTTIQQGTFLNSMTGGELGKEVELIVLDSFKLWQTFDVTNGENEKVWIESFPVNKENINYEYEYEDGGRKYRRRQGLIFTVLLGPDLAQGIKKLYTLDFYGASRYAGKNLVTLLNELYDQEYSSAAVVFKVSCEHKVDGSKSYWIKKIDAVRPASEKIVTELKSEYDSLQLVKDKIKFEDSDSAEETAVNNNVNPDDIPF